MEKHLSIEKKERVHERHFGERYLLVSFMALSFVVFGFTQNTPLEILNGLKRIVFSPDSLISDYVILGNMGSAFVNSGLLLLSSTFILYNSKMRLTAPAIAALFSIAGFGLFGKNLINVWFPIIGVKLYAMYNDEPFSHYAVLALFSTAVAPVASEIMFSRLASDSLSVLIGILVSISLGFLLAPIASAMVNVHQGLCLSNVGFTAGLLSTVIVSVLKSFGFTPTAKLLWSTGNNFKLGILLTVMFLVFIVMGFLDNGRNFRGYTGLLKYPGRLVSDFILLTGKGTTFMNMGIMGLLSTYYIILIGGDLNGPTVGSILFIFGFSAFGIHPRNSLPIITGIVLISLTNTLDLTWPSVQLAALLGLALAPVAGEFGLLWGIASGALHVTVVQYIGVLHGGLNLYNNGFSAGLVAIVMAPIIEAFRRERL